MEEHKNGFVVLECTWSVRREASVIGSGKEQLPGLVPLMMSFQQVPGFR